MSDLIHDLKLRVEKIEEILDISGIESLANDSIGQIKATIKRGSNDFNNNQHVNPYVKNSKLAEWWDFGYMYAKELDEE